MPSVLHLIASMGGGGAERQLALLAGGLSRFGWNVHVGLLRRGPNFHRLQQSGAAIHELRAAGSFDPRLFLETDALIRRIRPHVVQTWLPLMDIVGGMAALRAGVPWVVSERTSIPTPSKIRSLIRDRLNSRASAAVSNSLTAARRWRRRHPDVAVHEVGNALLADEIEAAPRRAALGDRPVVIAVARLAASKNLLVLIHAMTIVRRYTDAVLHVCGEGSLRKSIETWIRRHGLVEHVVLHGFSSEVWTHMKSASAFVSLSHFEGKPNAVLEAMCCGVPAILSDIPEHREIAGPDTALLVDHLEPEAVANAIVSTLTDHVAAARRVRAARAALPISSAEDVAAEHAAIYGALTATPLAQMIRV